MSEPLELQGENVGPSNESLVCRCQCRLSEIIYLNKNMIQIKSDICSLDNRSRVKIFLGILLGRVLTFGPWGGSGLARVRSGFIDFFLEDFFSSLQCLQLVFQVLMF